MKDVKIPVWVSYNATPDELNTDAYKRSGFKIVDTSVRSVMGLIDARLKKIDSAEIFVSFVNSLIINMFLRIGCFDLEREKYLHYCGKFYDQYQLLPALTAEEVKIEEQKIINNN